MDHPNNILNKTRCILSDALFIIRLRLTYQSPLSKSKKPGVTSEPEVESSSSLHRGPIVNLELGENHPSDIFDIKVEFISGVEIFAGETYFHYRIGSLFDTALALEVLPFALQGFLFRKMALKRMLEQSKEELNRNAGRIRYNFLEHIEKSLRKFRDELFFKVDATLTGIEAALERAALESEAGEEKVTRARRNLGE